MMMVNQQILEQFKTTIWNFYHEHGRKFDWRHVEDPYLIVVSEIMLQQTQTHRVAQKFPLFVQQFPNFKTLADAHLRDVLVQWQGLGYNRRGKFLHDAARAVMSEFNGQLPNNPELLVKLPGIGPNTAGSICAFAFNNPTLFIETNIRAVYIHFFFKGTTAVKDADIMPIIQATVDTEKARDWYYALMDYGVMLKKTVPNPSRKSAHHSKQSKFEGSDRQIRGMILKLLTSFATLPFDQFLHFIDREPERIVSALEQLTGEGLIERKGNLFRIN